MPYSPGITLVALLLWFLPLLTLRSEWQFLTTTPDVPRSQWVLSISVFVLFLVMDLLLLGHQYFNVLFLTTMILAALLLMILCSMLLMTGRLRIFARLASQSREERRAMIDGVRDLIDERKREKIRAKYGEDPPQGIAN